MTTTEREVFTLNDSTGQSRGELSLTLIEARRLARVLGIDGSTILGNTDVHKERFTLVPKGGTDPVHWDGW
jgi:hypothetical protein